MTTASAAAADLRAREIQRVLRSRGHDLGTTGPARDGVDGLWGDRTQKALLVEFAKVGPLPAAEPPAHPKVPMDLIKGAIATEGAYRVPASVTLAQWAVESGWGKKVSGKNNYGGVTAQVKGAVFPYKPGTPLEPATLCWTHEVVAGKRVKCQRWFKDYATSADYFAAHAKLLGTSPIYAEARSKYPDANAFADVLDPEYKPRAKDPNWRAYGTDLQYAETLKSVMRSNDFYRYDGWAA